MAHKSECVCVTLTSAHMSIKQNCVDEFHQLKQHHLVEEGGQNIMPFYFP